MKPANSPPARPAIAADSVKAMRLAAITSSPTAAASASLSRTASSVRPIGECTMRDTAATVSARKNNARYERAMPESNVTGQAARPGNSDHADVAVRERLPLLNHEMDDQPHREREDGEVVALAAKADRADGMARRRRKSESRPANQSRKPRRLSWRATPPRRRRCRRSRHGQRQLAREADDHIEAARRDREHVGLGQDLQVVPFGTMNGSTAANASADPRTERRKVARITPPP